jgi:hypothetical protein
VEAYGVVRRWEFQTFGLKRRPRFTPRKIFWDSFLLDAGKLQGLVRPEGLCKLKKFSELIVTGTRDLPTCSTAPQTSTLSRAPKMLNHDHKGSCDYWLQAVHENIILRIQYHVVRYRSTDVSGEENALLPIFRVEECAETQSCLLTWPVLSLLSLNASSLFA